MGFDVVVLKEAMMLDQLRRGGQLLDLIGVRSSEGYLEPDGKSEKFG